MTKQHVLSLSVFKVPRSVNEYSGKSNNCIWDDLYFSLAVVVVEGHRCCEPLNWCYCRKAVRLQTDLVRMILRFAGTVASSDPVTVSSGNYP